MDLNGLFPSLFSTSMNAFFFRRHLAESSRSLTGSAVINNLRSILYNSSPNPLKQGVQIVAKTAKRNQGVPVDVPIGIVPPHTVFPTDGTGPTESLRSEQDIPIIAPPQGVPVFPIVRNGPKEQNIPIPAHYAPIMGSGAVKKEQDSPIFVPPHIVGPYDGNTPMLRRVRRSLTSPLLPVHPVSVPPPPRDHHWDGHDFVPVHPAPVPPQQLSSFNGPTGNLPPPPPPRDHKDHQQQPGSGDGKKGHHGFFGGAWDSDSDSDGESDNEDEPQEKKAGGRPRRGPPVPEDKYFSGALGFGAEGDMCLYQNLDQLSDPCVSAVSDLYALRANYWAEDQVIRS